MSLYHLLRERESKGKPVRIGVIGAGTFSSAFLNQARVIPGMQVVCVADLDAEKAKRTCVGVGWSEDAIEVADSASSINDGAARGPAARVESRGKDNQRRRQRLRRDL
jgi:predicted homoserine dehydrogenase-like protein